MTIEIGDEWREFIDAKMEADGHGSAGEVIEAALARWIGDELSFAPGELDALLKPALEESERGEGIPLAEAMRQVREHIDAHSSKRLGA